MNNISHKLLIILVLNILLFLGSGRLISASDYHITRESVISIKAINDLQVAETFTITNLTSSKYASNYEIVFYNTSITDLIIISDNSKNALLWSSKEKDGKQIISVKLPPIVGKNKSQKIILSYIITNGVIQHGEMTEINIPNLYNSEIDSLIIDVEVKNDLGKPAYTSSHVSSVLERDKINIFRFENPKNNNNIKLLFGDHQVYQFALYYHLDNLNPKSGFFELTFPPDTNYQQVAITKLSQIPHSINLDSDGNWIAKYPVSSTNSPVVITGSVMVYARPVVRITNNYPSQVLNTKYWKSNDIIVNLANELKTPENIYNYVRTYLSYNDQKLGDNDSRLGAINALANPTNANCMEFTDLFIAIANQAGIPSRRIIGYAYSPELDSNRFQGDILHSWPEYFVDDQWRPIDPTWGNTTNGQDYFNFWDTQHVTLAINRQLDDYPLPPSGSDSLDSKNIIITSVGKFPNIEPALKFVANPNRYFLPFIKPTIDIYVSNLSGISQYNLAITDHLLDNIHLESLSDKNYLDILPFSKSVISFKLNHRWWLPEQILIESDGQIIKLPIPFVPRFFNITSTIAIVFLYIGACIYTIKLTFQAWNIRIFERKSRNHLHRKSNKSKK